MNRITYHPGGYDPAAPAQNRAEQWDDTTYTRWDKAGRILEQRPLDQAEQQAAAAAAAEQTRIDNATILRQQASQALAANRAFLAIATPTNAQTLAQVKALTRQNTGIIRLALNQLDGTD